MWDEVRAAAEVARRGTVSAAAEALGVHRATIHRRIDALEAYIGGKLFQRHTLGYTATELGQDILRIADEADGSLQKVRRRAFSRDDALSGPLIVTATDGQSPLVLSQIAEFTQLYPKIEVTFRASHELLRLEMGEAHVAFRLGPCPSEPDYVALPHEPLCLGFFASTLYIDVYGLPTAESLADHRYIIPHGHTSISPPERWLRALVEKPHLALVADRGAAVADAIGAGIGIGFVPIDTAQNDPRLVEVLPRDPAWQVTSWIVTHVDLHRSPKVQAFLEHCRRR
ncbi:MAG: LysR family transcriptional regulator [Pseudomonadota bacterium]